jgi:HD-like signal output (HDOD) protein
VAPITERARGCRQRALRALEELPPFSPVLNRLLSTLSNENASTAKISEIIETDTVIAGNVLKVVNSALYGRRGTVNSVRHAVSLLGINKLRNTVFAMSISRLWRQVHTAGGWSMAKFNLHSVACGLLSDLLVQRVPITYPEGAFAAGLFHDLGQLLIAVGLPEEYEDIKGLFESGHGSLSECEEDVIGTSHAELSAHALAVWNLPAAIQSAVRFHHAPERDPTKAPAGGFGLALTLHCADTYVDSIGISPYLSQDASPDSSISEPFAPLGIQLASADFLGDFNTELEALSQFFH